MSKIKIFSLGGLNEIGKNMYIVEVNDDIFVFDAGLKYADDNMLGVDYIIPNYDYLKENKDRIKGLFITHGHDQQLGAISDILLDIPDLKIYGTTFTLEILKEQLKEDNISTDNLFEIKAHKKINFGENSIFPISLTHAVPDAVGYVLYTKDGAIFYTGNFVFDPSMQGAYKTDVGKLAYVGKQGVLCLLSESMYADKKGFTSPNHRTSSIIRETLFKNNNSRILFNTFQAQLYRIQELFTEVMKTNRKVIIMGKRLEALIIKAIDNGYINFDKSRIASLKEINDKNVVIIISDEREKPYSNIKRIIRGYDLSLHASSEDLMLMLDLMKPKYYFPVIGEYRHQVANKEVAEQIGMKKEDIILNLNGEVATFIDGKLVETGEKVKVDDILIDGKTPGDIGELVLKDRELLSDNGIVIVTATLDKMTKQILAGPEILTRGFIYVKENIDLIKEAQNISRDIIENNIKPHYVDFNKIKMEVRDKVGKYFYDETECKPMILIVIQEV